MGDAFPELDVSVDSENSNQSKKRKVNKEI